MAYYKTFFILFILSISKGLLPAQDYEVCLQLNTYDPRDLSSDLHPYADYERKPDDNLLSYIVKSHYEGEIDLYLSKDLLKRVPSDSLEFYTKIPEYEKLDSVFTFEFYENLEYEIDFTPAYQFLWGHIRDSGVSQNDSLDLSGFDDIEFLSSSEIDSQNTQKYTSFWSGWDFLDVDQRYDLFLHENWSVHNGSIETKSKYIRIALIYGEPPSDFTTDSLIRTNIFISPKDFDKIPIERIFRRKWGAIQEEKLGMAFTNRNFPCEIFSIKIGDELIYKERIVNHHGEHQFLEKINYPKFAIQTAKKRKQLETESLSPVILQIDKSIREEIRNHKLFDPKSTVINHSFFEGELFQSLIQNCIDGNIPMYGILPWEWDTIIENNDLKTHLLEKKIDEKKCLIILDSSHNKFIHSSDHPFEKWLKEDLLVEDDFIPDSSFKYIEYLHLDTIYLKDYKLNFDDFSESIFVEGAMYKTKSQVSFVPSWLLFMYKGEISFRIKVKDLLSQGMDFDGKQLQKNLASLKYFGYPVVVNNAQIHTYSKIMYLKEFIFTGNWEEIHQEEINPAACAGPPKIAPFPY